MAINNKDIVNNMGWQFLQRFSAQIVTFLVGLVLARLLSPEEYGVVAIVHLVVTFFDSFTYRGFNQALLQKKDPDSLDYSTVCWFNIGLNVVFFAGLFLAAPLIADFYDEQSLTPMIRVMSARLIISGYDMIQQTYIQKNMLFKKLVLPSIVSTVISAVVGIAMAFMGAGAWALVFQTFVGAALNAVILFFSITWRPRFVFSFERLKGMSRYGISMLLTSLVESVYNELRGLLIGKLYSKADLAFHDKGRQIPTLVMSNVQNSVSTVFFSALTHENSRADMHQKVRDNLGMMMFVMGPVLMGLASVSAPLITFLYTEKWVGAAPYMVMYCLSYLTWVIQTPVLQALNAIGKADTTLRLTTIHCFIGLGLLFAMMSLGPVAVAASVTVANVIITVIIMMVYNKHFTYSLLDLVKDVGLTVVQLGVMVLTVSLVGNLASHVLVKLIIQVLTGAAVYVLLSELLKNKAYLQVKQSLLEKLRRKV